MEKTVLRRERGINFQCQARLQGDYRNLGGWQFVDVTAESGTGDPGFGLGVAIGDYDNDGNQDIFVSNYGPNVLYRNNGDGTFADVTGEAGVAGGGEVGAGACFLDIEADGDLDLYLEECPAEGKQLVFAAECHHNLGDDAKAQALLDAALAQSPTDAAAFGLRGTILSQAAI